MLGSTGFCCLGLLYLTAYAYPALPDLSCHLDECSITLQAVLLWADADPIIRAPHTPQLFDHIPAPNLYIMLENIRQLPCMPEVEEALHRWVKCKKHDLGATASGDSCCTLDDFTRHQQPSRGQLLIAGGHDVTWQSLRSIFTPCSQLLCGHSQANSAYANPTSKQFC